MSGSAWLALALGALLIADALVVVVLVGLARRRDRLRRPCVVVDLQAVALERARRAERTRA